MSETKAVAGAGHRMGKARQSQPPVNGISFPWNKAAGHHRRIDQPDLSWQELVVVVALIAITSGVIIAAVVAPGMWR